MPFNDDVIAAHAALIEKLFWSKRRPPLHLRDKIREGQRIEGWTIDLFFVRPAFAAPGKWIESPIARLRYFPGLGVWKIYWMRADLKWHLYKPQPELVKQSELLTLVECLRIVNEDRYNCFFG